MAYKPKLERFDMERGDVLSLTREACIELRDLGKFAPKVIMPLIKYVAGNPGDPIPEVEEENEDLKIILSATLHRYIEHQKQNAARRADFLAKQASNANARWKGKDATTCHGIPTHTTAPSISIREVEEESLKEKDFPSSTTSDLPNELGHAGDTPAHAATGDGLNAAPCGTRKITRVAYIDPEWGNQIDARTFDEAELRARPVSFMLAAIGEEDDQRARNALKKAVKELGLDTFAETCWRFVADMVQAENAYAAAAIKARDRLTEKYGDEADAKLSAALKIIATKGSCNPKDDYFVIPWRKWRNFQPGCFLMFAIKEAKLAAGIPTKRKGGDE